MEETIKLYDKVKKKESKETSATDLDNEDLDSLDGQPADSLERQTAEEEMKKKASNIAQTRVTYDKATREQLSAVQLCLAANSKRNGGKAASTLKKKLKSLYNGDGKDVIGGALRDEVVAALKLYDGLKNQAS